MIDNKAYFYDEENNKIPCPIFTLIALIYKRKQRIQYFKFAENFDIPVKSH